MMKFELMNYVTKPVLSGVLLITYSMVVEGKGFNNDDGLFFDAGIMALSTLSAKLADDLLQNNIDMKQYSVVGYILEPVISGFVYDYLYRNEFVEKYNRVSNRDFKTNFILSSLLNVVTTYIHNPLIGFISGTKIY